jgi:glycosyltransferase involved in cell wall biosynthesis
MPQHDVCLAHLIRTGEYIRSGDRPRVLEMTDAISMNYARVRASGAWRGLMRAVYSVESGRLLEYERDIIPDFNIVTLVSDVDRDFLLGSSAGEQSHVIVCPNGVDLVRLPFWTGQHEEVVVFIGNMTTIQNLDACTYFIESVLPEVLRRRRVVFRIIGNIHERDARRFRMHSAVDVTGRVANIAQAAQGAVAGVCPVRLGAGIQNKVLEYMALGIPAITSSVGLEGLGATPGTHLLVANAPGEYASNIEKLLNDRSLTVSIASAAREFVERHHQWARLVAPLGRRIRELLPDCKGG